MRGFFAIGVFHSKSKENIGTLFRSAHAFGAAFIFTVGRRYTQQITDTMAASKHIPCFHFPTLDDLKSHLPLNCELVGIELHPKAKPLPQFAHAHTACYLLGAEDHGLNDDAIAACHRLVQIPGAERPPLPT